MITRQQATERRDASMALATDKAERDKPGWADDALAAIELYTLAFPKRQFLCEQVRDWAESYGLVSAPRNARAWGSIFRRAERINLIRFVGYAPARSSHLSPKCLWEAA